MTDDVLHYQVGVYSEALHGYRCACGGAYEVHGATFTHRGGIPLPALTPAEIVAGGRLQSVETSTRILERVLEASR